MGGGGIDSDHLSVAQRSMDPGGGNPVGEAGEGVVRARLNMWPTVTGPQLNMQPVYLQATKSHSLLVPLTQPLITNG